MAARPASSLLASPATKGSVKPNALRKHP
jgi:hypothetical protein